MNPVIERFSRRNLPVASVPFDAVAIRPVEGAKTVLITALPYYFPTQEEQNLARFAALPDYHQYFGKILEEIAEELKERYGSFFFKPYTDNSPIDEQKAALLSGLAVKGKNNLCITSKGSFIFLGEIITDGDLKCSASPVTRSCGTCRLCIDACPNGALTEDGFDYSKCLAYLTQKKGELTAEERAAIRNNNMAWGCDRCSEVCPHNQGLPRAEISLPPNELLLRLTVKDIEGLTDRQFRQTYALRAFAWKGKATMLRNLYILEDTEL